MVHIYIMFPFEKHSPVINIEKLLVRYLDNFTVIKLIYLSRCIGGHSTHHLACSQHVWTKDAYGMAYIIQNNGVYCEMTVINISYLVGEISFAELVCNVTNLVSDTSCIFLLPVTNEVDTHQKSCKSITKLH